MSSAVDQFAAPTNNLMDGRLYEWVLLNLQPDDLREGDIIENGTGTYQVAGVGDWVGITGSSAKYIRHIRISHTITGPVMGGLVRGTEYIRVIARRRA